jgi:hypothetical protein
LSRAGIHPLRGRGAGVAPNDLLLTCSGVSPFHTASSLAYDDMTIARVLASKALVEVICDEKTIP